MAFCTRCGAGLAPGAAYCAACGAPATQAPAAPVTLAPPPPATNVHVHISPPPPEGRRPITQGLAIAGLLLNILVWPGLGSLVAGESVGWAQGFLTLLAAILTITLVGAIVGIPLAIGMWIWGLVTGIQLVNRAGAQPPAGA